MYSSANSAELPQPPKERLFDRFGSERFKLGELDADLQRAIARGDYAVAEGIINITPTDHYNPNDNARHRMMELSMPRLEQSRLLLSGNLIDTTLTQTLDEIYPQAGAALQEFTEQRLLHIGNSSPLDILRRKQYTGAVSELAVFALFNREGSKSPYMVFSSTKREDNAGYNNSGERTAIDMRIISAKNLNDQTEAQVKTRSSVKSTYARNILIIAMEELAGSYVDGIHALPEAIVEDALGGGVSKQDQRLLNRAEAMLLRRTAAHIKSLKK